MDDRSIDLVAENIDVALRLGTLTDSSLKARKLAQADRVVVASPAYLARRGVPMTPADLNEHEAIVYSQRSGGEEWLFRRGTSETLVRLQSRLTLTAAEGVRTAVIAGHRSARAGKEQHGKRNLTDDERGTYAASFRGGDVGVSRLDDVAETRIGELQRWG
jgi:DNA-binding transcriptional LysR family regulator